MKPAFQNLSGMAKKVHRRRSIALNIYATKEEKLKITEICIKLPLKEASQKSIWETRANNKEEKLMR